MYDSRLEEIKLHGERLSDSPSEDDEQGDDEQSDLDGRSDGDGEGEVDPARNGKKCKKKASGQHLRKGKKQGKGRRCDRRENREGKLTCL